MAIREFSDASGQAWKAWETVPTTSHETQLFRRSAELRAEQGGASAEEGASAERRFTEGREHGWLTFACDAEKRRLSPIPDGWADASDAQLARWLERADPVRLSQAATDLLARGAKRDRSANG